MPKKETGCASATLD